MIERLRTLWFWLTKYAICIEWEGRQITHWAKTEEEARQWLACYPDGLAVYGKRGRMIGARWTV